MRSRPDRPLQGGRVRLEMTVGLLLLLVLLGIFLQRMLELQRDMERVIVDAEVMSLRTELQLAVASRIVRGEEGRLKDWERRNPLQLAGRDENDQPPTRSPGGASLSAAWHWDAAQEVLVYRYADGQTLRLRIGRIPLAGRDGWSLGGGLLLLRERP